MHHRRWVIALVLFLFLSGGANSSRIAAARQNEKKEDKKLAFSYDTNDKKRVALGARFLEDDQMDSQEECMSNAFFLFLTNIITAAGVDSKDQKRISSANIWCRRKIKTR